MASEEVRAAAERIAGFLKSRMLGGEIHESPGQPLLAISLEGEAARGVITAGFVRVYSAFYVHIGYRYADTVGSTPLLSCATEEDALTALKALFVDPDDAVVEEVRERCLARVRAYLDENPPWPKDLVEAWRESGKDIEKAKALVASRRRRQPEEVAVEDA